MRTVTTLTSGKKRVELRDARGFLHAINQPAVTIYNEDGTTHRAEYYIRGKLDTSGAPAVKKYHYLDEGAFISHKLMDTVSGKWLTNWFKSTSEGLVAI